MSYALIDAAGKVVNLIEYDPEGGYISPPGHTLVVATSDAKIGGTWTGSAFIAAPAPSPDQFAADKVRLWKYMSLSESTEATAVSNYIADIGNPAAVRLTMLSLRSLIRLVHGERENEP